MNKKGATGCQVRLFHCFYCYFCIALDNPELPVGAPAGI
jgi:hypothetical protein